MFGIPGKAAVTLTARAVTHIKSLVADSANTPDGPAIGLRVGVKKGGCAGMEYDMAMAREISPHDEIVEQDGATVIIAPTAAMFLIGTEIDYEVSLLESGFKFRNPNVVEACGCGESIKFAAQTPE